jgi:hypothetical protein
MAVCIENIKEKGKIMENEWAKIAAEMSDRELSQEIRSLDHYLSDKGEMLTAERLKWRQSELEAYRVEVAQRAESK